VPIPQVSKVVVTNCFNSLAMSPATLEPHRTFPSKHNTTTLLVSTGLSWEVLICTNTLKRSLFDVKENVQIDWRFLELWQILCCWYQEGSTSQ